MTALVPPAAPRPRAWHRWLVLAAIGALAVWVAASLAFLCDDAYIHFRYAANAHDGHGLVWNAAPFQPVEGYGFLWVVTLWGAWSWLGVEPPVAANPLSIGFGLLHLVSFAGVLWRLRDRGGRALPLVVTAAALLAIVGNRGYVQWWSSGLDTALFNLWCFGWVLHACRPVPVRGARWLATWAAFAALAALTRPDGLPMVCATAAVAVWHAARGVVSWRTTVLGLLPLLAVVAHVGWRRAYYGEWLPNTYAAKVVSAWPEAGLRYAACFALENGAWLWALPPLAWLLARVVRPRVSVAAALQHAPAVAAVSVVLFNAAYYLLRVGGDHFEYRVLSPLVPLGVLAGVAVVARASTHWRWPLATALAFMLAGGVGWWHLAVTASADPVRNGVQPVTPSAPGFAKPLARWFDRQQLWLFVRYVGLRCQHHATVLAIYAASGPPARGPVGTSEPFPVLATGAVGLPSWLLADCAILDLYGLNDWVIARAPSAFRAPVERDTIAAAVAAADADADGWLGLVELRTASARAFGTDAGNATGDFLLRFLIETHAEARPDAITRDEAVAGLVLLDAPRQMAHERRPPQAYVDAFAPNTTMSNGAVHVQRRPVPLTAERIEAIEAEWRAKLRGEGTR